MAGLIDLYQSASAETRQEGLDWYRTAHDECCKLARGYRGPSANVIGMVSALSPQTRWWVNLRGAARMIEAYAMHNDLPNGVTLYRFNAEKAWDILTGQRPVSTAFKPNTKTWAFYHNLMGDYSKVTIDTWMLRALGETRKSLGIGAYRRYAQLIADTAVQEGLQPAQFQAIVWLAVQRQEIPF